MKRAINEIQGMVLKAARGAGVPLGIAEDLSDCVPYALANNVLNDIVDVLGQSDHAHLIAISPWLMQQFAARRKQTQRTCRIDCVMRFVRRGGGEHSLNRPLARKPSAKPIGRNWPRWRQ